MQRERGGRWGEGGKEKQRKGSIGEKWQVGDVSEDKWMERRRRKKTVLLTYNNV